MEAIEKAKIVELRDRLASQVKQTQEQLVGLADTVKQSLGAVSVLNHLLTLDTVTIDESDEITEDDLGNPDAWVEAAVMDAP